MEEYKLKGGKITKDGHTMFIEDVVKDLKRKAFLEHEKAQGDKPPMHEVVMSRDINVPQARKFFHDWLDQNRLWATTKNVYDMMDKMVDAATRCFTKEIPPSKEQIAHLEQSIETLTKGMSEHLEGYEGPCMCNECLNNM